MISQDDNLNLSDKESSSNVTDEREACPKFWVAAYTRPRSEKKVSAELAKSGIETYVPIQKQLRFWSDRKKYVDVVVIPMIIFAYITEKDILTLKKHPLVLRILSYSGSGAPAHIPPKQIESLKILLSQSRDEVNFIRECFSTDDKVMVVTGSLRGLVGNVKEVENDMTTVWIGVDLLGGAIIKLNSTELERYE